MAIASGSENNVSLRYSPRHLLPGGEPCTEYSSVDPLISAGILPRHIPALVGTPLLMGCKAEYRPLARSNSRAAFLFNTIDAPVLYMMSCNAQCRSVLNRTVPRDTCCIVLLYCNSMRADEGRKVWSLLAINSKAPTVVGKGEKSLVSDPGSELQLGKEIEKKRVRR